MSGGYPAHQPSRPRHAPKRRGERGRPPALPVHAYRSVRKEIKERREDQRSECQGKAIGGAIVDQDAASEYVATNQCRETLACDVSLDGQDRDDEGIWLALAENERNVEESRIS